MFVKCIILLTVLSVMDALSEYGSRSCLTPRISHGKIRSRQRSKLIKFICYPGYDLVGNRYSTCRNGQWDTPKPTCVKPGCMVPILQNGLTIPSRRNAWVVFFCMPGFKLRGSSAIYCDGEHWNSTAPTCVHDVKVNTTLSCNFEEFDLCGWAQDTTHDFDWERLNKDTPSSFLFTGPSFDHTYGKGKDGYYMYIESSSRLENDTARLISPIYDAALAKDGCFSFYYHMFGKDIGGLRVYQKPDSLGLESLLNLPTQEMKKYLLFQQWGNQGDVWYGDVSQLRDFSDNFQIVVEGIRGRRFTSDIAIDDVAILQGQNCTLVKNEMTTPQNIIPDSCEGRCVSTPTARIALGDNCSCYYFCYIYDNCCSDFFDVCINTTLDYTTDDVIKTTKQELPQTQKLVANNSSPTPLPSKPQPPRVQSTIIMTPTRKSFTIPPKSTIALVSKPQVNRTKTSRFIFQKDAIKENSTVKPVDIAYTTEKLAPVKTEKPRATIAPVKRNRTVPVTTIKIQTTLPTTTAAKRSVANKKEVVLTAASQKSGNSSAWRPVLITLAVLISCCAMVWVAVRLRGARGKLTLDFMRGRTTHDPEVRYLHSDVDDELQ